MSTPPTQKIHVLDLLRMLFSSAIYGVFIINVRWIEKSSFTKKSSGKKNHSFKVKEWSDLRNSVLRSIEKAAYFKSYKTTWNWHLNDSYSIFSCNWISWLSNLFFFNRIKLSFRIFCEKIKYLGDLNFGKLSTILICKPWPCHPQYWERGRAKNVFNKTSLWCKSGFRKRWRISAY